jgi:hypothetical protein
MSGPGFFFLLPPPPKTFFSFSQSVVFKAAQDAGSTRMNLKQPPSWHFAPTVRELPT